MKKSNVVVFAVLAMISAFLLWLWYFLGFNRVDDPLDLVLSVVWWAVVAAAILVVARFERTRRRRVRTVYVGDAATFNSERGVTPLDPAAPVQDSVAAVLEELEYGFAREDFPKPEDLEVRYFIHTDEFEPAERSNLRPSKWTGEVVVAGSGRARPFDTPEGLSRILAVISRTA